MLDQIKRETKSVIHKCCSKHAASNKISLEDVQLILGLTKEGSNTYTLCEKYVPKREMTILQVLGVLIDLKMRDIYAPDFIKKSLVRFSKDYKVGVDSIRVMCIPTTDERGKPDVKLYLYNGDVYVKPNEEDAFVDNEENADGSISFDSLFKQEDLFQ